MKNLIFVAKFQIRICQKNDKNATKLNSKAFWVFKTFFGEFNSQAWNVRLMHYCYKPFVATCITTNNYFVGGIECIVPNAFYGNKRGWIIALALSL